MSTNDELSGRPNDSDQLRQQYAGEQGLMDDFESTLEEKVPRTRWHIGLDLGLFILRIAVGGTMVLSGLYKYGMFGGPRIEGLAQALETIGFSQSTVLAWVLVATEIGAGGALVLGLFTPLAAAAVLSVTATATYLGKDVGYFSDPVQGDAVIPGYGFPLLTGAAALALLFTGPGRIALDAPTPWRRGPLPYGLVGVLLAAAAAVIVLFVFR